MGQGVAFDWEVTACEGWEKGFVIVLECPEDQKSDVAAMMEKALPTFRMKE